MTDMEMDEQAIAQQVQAAINTYSDSTERSLQAGNFKVGVSDLGFCSERTRRMIGQHVPESRDVLAAFIGTAIGRDVEAALAAAWDDAIIQSEVSVTLQGDTGVYTITGHPDVVRTDYGAVFDIKTARGLALVQRRGGPDQSQQFQRHLYAKGAHQSGMFGDLALEDVMVGNIWIDRAADDVTPYVQMEPYNEEIVQQATAWLDDVVYAFLNEEAARKEPPREMCEKVCGFFADCRALDTDVSGLLTADEVLLAIDMHQDGSAMIREGKRLLDQATAALKGIGGSTGRHTVRWVTINGGKVNYERRSYERLNISTIKTGARQ